MNNYPLREILRNFFSVVAGVLLVFSILFLFSSSFFKPGVFPPLEGAYPARYAVLYESYYQKHAWIEIGALIAGFFIGGLVASLISTRKNLLHALLVPVVVLCFYYSIIGREIVALALPLWMFISLLSWKLSEWIKYKRKRKIAT
jgi:hypothetical protein